MIDALAPMRKLRRVLGDAEGRVVRRASVNGPRAYIEVRGIHRPDGQEVADAVRSALTALRGVDWAEVDAVAGRAVIMFDPEEVEPGDIEAAIRDVEQARELDRERFPADRPDHPSDSEPVRRHALSVATDLAGLGVAAIGTALRLPELPPEVPGAIALVESQPRLRRVVESRMGAVAADATLGGAGAIAQALAHGPSGLLVDIGRRASLIAEQLARQSAWRQREPELVSGPRDVSLRARELPERPIPLPKGPIERYSDRAALASLALVGLALPVTRDPRKAADLVFTGIPKAATEGREAFAAWLDVVLSRRGVLVMDPSALRRLDRACTLVVDGRLAGSATWSVEEVHPVGDVPAQECLKRAGALLDRCDPLADRHRRSWELSKWSGDPDAPRGSASAARRLRRGGRHVLGLRRSGELVALVSVAEEPDPMLAALVDEAASVPVEVVLAGGSDALARRLGGIGRCSGNDAVEMIRARQLEGEVVLYLSGRAHGGLRAADVGVGVPMTGRRPPLGAHLVLGEGLGDMWVVMEAVRRAREVSRRSALLALAGAGTGAAWGFMSPRRVAAQRAMLAVNLSAIASMFAGASAGLGLSRVTPPIPPAAQEWHELSAAEALRLLGSSRNGLESDEHDERNRSAGSAGSAQPDGFLHAAWEELANPLTPILGMGAALSAAVGSLTDAGLVMGVLGVNSMVGAAQRVRTERALKVLEDRERPLSRVLIGGALVELAAEEVVPGDVVRLCAGDIVPADCRLIEATDLEVDESTLTGESMPVRKAVRATSAVVVAERTSMLYGGTVVVAGEAAALVVAVGEATEAGRSSAAAGDPPPSGVEQRLHRITRFTLPVTVGAGAVVTGLSLLRRRPLQEAVGTGVSLTVAAVPEGLPTLASLAQIASARRLARRGALVRNPHAIEALGRVNQLCFDKTGTLTQGTLSVVVVTDGVEELDPSVADAGVQRVLGMAQRATSGLNGNGTLPHATDRAVAAAAEAIGRGDDDNGWVRISDLPFESSRGLQAVLGRKSRTRSVAVKGAPEAVIPLCADWRRARGTVPLGPEQLAVLHDHVHSLGRRGLRVLAVASGRGNGVTRLDALDDVPSLTLEGFVAIADPVRDTARAAVTTLQGAGVHLSMITGDHPSTAEAIAVELGMMNGGRLLTGAEMEDLDDAELDKLIGEVSVFARVTPLQKVRIVSAYQRCGRVVAMTGDGANDAAAIRLADAGIALGGHGTDAARGSADVVVVDDRLETIVDAVVEGRAMWESVRAAVAILVGGNLGEIGFTLAGTALGGGAPLNPRQLLLVNLLTDMAPALTLALREPPKRSPEDLLHAGPEESLGSALTRDIVVRAGATATGATGAWVAARLTGTPTRARTVGLAALVGTQLAQTLLAGGISPNMLAATGLSVGALVATVQTPGVSGFFGCRPLGPIGWSTALAATAAATVASVAVPWAVERVGEVAVARLGVDPASTDVDTLTACELPSVPTS